MAGHIFAIGKRMRVLLGVAAILAALAAAAVAVFSAPWFRRVLERRMVAALEQTTGGRVEIGELQFRPMELQVVFHDLVVHGGEAPGEPALFTARLVVIRLSPIQLLHRRLRMSRLDCNQVEVHVRTNPDGSTNLPDPVARLDPKLLLNQMVDLSIRRVTLAHCNLFWNNRRLPLDLDARDLAVLLGYQRGGRYVGTLAFSNTVVRTPRWSPPPLTVASRFEFSRRKLDVTSLAWQTSGARGEGTLTFQTAPTATAYFSYQASAKVKALASMWSFPALRAGNLRMEGQGLYREGEFSSQGRLQAGQLVVADPQFESGRIDLSANYRAEGDQVELSGLTFSGLGGTAQGQAKIRLGHAAPSFQLSARLHRLNLTALLRAGFRGNTFLTLLRPSAQIDGAVEAAWAGRFENFASKFDLTFGAPETLPPGSLPFSGAARGTLRGDGNLTVNVDDASFQSPRSSLSVHGEIGTLAVAGNGLAVEWKTTDFEEWRPLVEELLGATRPLPIILKSPATFSGEVTGPFSGPQVRGQLEVGAFVYHGWDWDKLAANVVASSSFAQVSSGRLQHQGSTLSLEASAVLDNWKIVPDSAVHFSARAQRTPLEGLKAALGLDYPVAGSVTGRFDLDGSASAPSGVGALRIENGQLFGEPFDYLAANLHISKSMWTLKDLDLARGPGHVKGEINWDPARRYGAGRVQAADLSLSDLMRLATPGRRPVGADSVEGQLAFDLRAEGTPEEFQLHATWGISSVVLGHESFGQFKGQLDGQGQSFRVQGEGSGPSGSLQFSGEVRSAAGWPLEIAGEYRNFHVDPWFQTFRHETFPGHVVATGAFKLAGPLRNPTALEARSRAETLEISFPGLRWKNDQPVDLRYAADVLSLSRFRMRGPGTDLDVEGSIRLAQLPELAINAQGTSDATLLSLLDPNLHATGHSDVKVRLAGAPSAPLLNGTIDVQDVSLSYGNLPFRLSALSGTLRLDGGRVNLASLHGVSGGGTFTLGGSVLLAENPRYNLSGTLEQVRVPYPRDFTSVLSGKLRLSGTPERSELQGELLLRQIFANVNINWVTRIVEAEIPFEEQPTVTSPLASRTHLNVHVISTPPVRLDTQDLHAVGDLDVRIQGTLANPVQLGTIHLLSGDALFRGNRYTLTRGDINLTNPSRTQASLDLEARTRVQRYDLTLDISGPFDRLKFAYRSDPPLPTADILSLLALGYARESEAMATAGGQPTRSVGASALLSEALSSQVTGRIQRLFGVSRIKVDPNVATPGFGTGARVTVEQQLTPDFTLTYVTNTAYSQYRIIQFEWTLSERLSLLGVRDQNGIFGVEVRLRHRFK